MKKNKELNDDYVAGVAALEAAPQGADAAAKAAKYDEAITNFNKASELDPTQLAVWEKTGRSLPRSGRCKDRGRQDRGLR